MRISTSKSDVIVLSRSTMGCRVHSCWLLHTYLVSPLYVFGLFLFPPVFQTGVFLQLLVSVLLGGSHQPRVICVISQALFKLEEDIHSLPDCWLNRLAKSALLYSLSLDTNQCLTSNSFCTASLNPSDRSGRELEDPTVHRAHRVRELVVEDWTATESGFKMTSLLLFLHIKSSQSRCFRGLA